MKRITKMCLLALCTLWVCLLPLRAQADEVDLTRVPVIYVDEYGNARFDGETVDVTEEMTTTQTARESGITTRTMGEMKFDGMTWRTFTTLDELYQLASEDYQEVTEIAYVGDGMLTLTKDLTIPENLQLYPSWNWGEENGLVIPKGIKLTVNGYVGCRVMEVSGELITQGWGNVTASQLTFDGTIRNDGTVGGERIERKENGSYSGYGTLEIWTPDGSWQNGIVGFDAADFEVDNQYVVDENLTITNLRYGKGLTKLDAPTELKWGYDYRYNGSEMALVGKPGAICYQAKGQHQNSFRIAIYNAEDGRLVHMTEYRNYDNGREYYTYVNWDAWEIGEAPKNGSLLESGTYYFTVQALGDYVEYRNSDVVKSDNWVYVQPEAKVDTFTNVVKTRHGFSWEGANGKHFVSNMRYAPTKDTEPQFIHSGMGYGNEEQIPDFVWSAGPGYYYYSVRQVSDDITQAQHSDWSEEIEFYINPTLDGVNQSLNSINPAATPEEIKSAVQAVDIEELKMAMAADTDNSGTMDTLIQLEEKVGGPAGVAVAEEVPAFDADKVSIVGANLNTTNTEGGVTLNIAKPEKEHVLDTCYNSALAVSFSMVLENVENTENLQVPVKITLPIPSNINPSFLVLLHYHADGTMENIMPYITYQDGQAYASFVLTSFSDFVMTELVAPEVNRVAGDDRYATAIKTAEELKAVLGVEKFNAIIVASGSDFADALAGSYLSTVKSAPILLSWGKGGKYAALDTTNLTYIKNNLAEGGTVYILGGTSAVPDLYQNELAGYNVKRLGGQDRFETNRKILAEAGVPAGSEILVCTGKSFPDSLSASAVGKPILLVMEHKGQPYGIDDAYLKSLQGCRFTIIGGTSAVSENLANKLAAYGNTYRLAGDNRFSTSILVAEKYFDAPTSAVLAYAWNYPDGLCGGALAYAKKAPLILTMDGYEEEAVTYAHGNGIADGTVLGGSGLIGDAAVRSIFNMAEDAVIIKK